MRLVRLAGRGMRNLAPFDLDLDAPFLVFHGANAQGKTNALEAVWVLASLRPLRTARPSELVAWGERALRLDGWVAGDVGARHHRFELSDGERQVALDGKRCADLAEYFRDLRAICFTPADAEIVAGGPEHRRRWIDRAAFTARPAHLGLVRDHQRALLHKGAALRASRPDGALLDALDAQLAALGARLADRRARVLAELAPHVARVYRGLAEGDGRIELGLRTVAAGGTERDREGALAEALARARAGELRRRRALVGVQTDEVAIGLGGHPARGIASRGQVRSLVLALKLAEMHAARERGVMPIFLLDDLSSELDRARTARLVEHLGELGAQVLVTTTDPDALAGMAPGAQRRFAVRAGVLTPG